jgi:hypothetical protein
MITDPTPAPAVAGPSDRLASPAASERRFYTAMTFLLLGSVFLGFARTFYLRVWYPELAHRIPPEPVFFWHGLLVTGWFLLLVTQAVLVGRKSVALHRQIGRWSPALTVPMILTGFFVALVAGGRPTGFMGVPVPPLVFMVVPISSMVLFSTFYTLAIVRARDVQAHKRHLLLGSIVMVEAAIARWPFVPLAPSPVPQYMLHELITCGMILPLAAWDIFSRGRLHAVTLWGGLIIIAHYPLRMMFAGTELWQSFAAWAVQLAR